MTNEKERVFGAFRFSFRATIFKLQREVFPLPSDKAEYGNNEPI